MHRQDDQGQADPDANQWQRQGFKTLRVEFTPLEKSSIDTAQTRTDEDQCRRQKSELEQVIEVQGKVSALLEELSKSGDTEGRSKP